MLKKVLLIVCLCVLAISLGGCNLYVSDRYSNYKTDAVEDYLKNLDPEDGETVKIIRDFFPDKIEDDFTDVKYHYQASPAECEPAGYECYLEFKIQDEEKYLSFFTNHSVDRSAATPFRYDDTFLEISYYDAFNFYLDADYILPDTGKAYVSHAGGFIKKILFSDEQQCIIYYLFSADETEYNNLYQLRYFFDRFNIEPLEYDMNLKQEYLKSLP